MISTISIKKQDELLSKCVEHGLVLSDELARLGLNYDNLRYRTHSSSEYSWNGTVDTLDDLELPLESNIPAVSFFSGAGGLDIGFEYAGFHNVAAIEHTELFCDTLSRNSDNKIIIGPPNFVGDVSDFESIADVLKNQVGIGVNFEGVFHGGPPCQSFSIAANQRFGRDDSRFKRLGFDDPARGGLFFDYVKLIRHFRPRAFLIENVAGIQDFDTDGRIAKELESLSSLGYSIISPKIVNAADYGVPQNRLRWIVYGARDCNGLSFPKSDTAIHVPCYEVLRRPINDGTKNHQTRRHAAATVKRYIELEFGARDHKGRVDRLNPNSPSKTIIAGGIKGGGRSHLHPYIPRTLSVRESARLQGFPDWYEFVGPTARQFTQVGNAVPPLLAYKLAESLRDQLF